MSERVFTASIPLDGSPRTSLALVRKMHDVLRRIVQNTDDESGPPSTPQGAPDADQCTSSER